MAVDHKYKNRLSQYIKYVSSEPTFPEYCILVNCDVSIEPQCFIYDFRDCVGLIVT